MEEEKRKEVTRIRSRKREEEEEDRLALSPATRGQEERGVGGSLCGYIFFALPPSLLSSRLHLPPLTFLLYLLSLPSFHSLSIFIILSFFLLPPFHLFVFSSLFPIHFTIFFPILFFLPLPSTYFPISLSFQLYFLPLYFKFFPFSIIIFPFTFPSLPFFSPLLTSLPFHPSPHPPTTSWHLPPL